MFDEEGLLVGALGRRGAYGVGAGWGLRFAVVEVFLCLKEMLY